MIEEEREDQAHREIERRGDDPRFEGSAGRGGDPDILRRITPKGENVTAGQAAKSIVDRAEI